MALSTTELDRLADNIVASAMTVRAHSADPGDDQTADRIGNADADLAAADWSDASSGDVMYEEHAELGVLDAGAEQVVTHYSVWRGNAPVMRGAINPAVTVPANGTFRINANTIRALGSTT